VTVPTDLRGTGPEAVGLAADDPGDRPGTVGGGAF
jgi:hypothetical protein